MKEINVQDLQHGDIFMHTTKGIRFYKSALVCIKSCAQNGLGYAQLNHENIWNNLDPKDDFRKVKSVYIITTLKKLGHIIEENFNES